VKRTLILGGPGAGKTTHLIETVKRAIESGVSPDRVAFVSFTRAAAYEARDRAVQALGLSADQLPWFRTLHSLCFRVLGLERKEVFSRRHRNELAELVGGSAEEDEPMMAIASRARITMRGLKSEWEASSEDASWYRLLAFAEAYDGYRSDRSVYDFTDMLQEYLDGDIGPVPVDMAVIDEAQDFSLLQWRVVEKAFANCRDVYCAGDDDQAIHAWAGADREYFLNLPVDRIDVLPVSHRLPLPVFDLGQGVSSRISRRYAKEIRSSGKEGSLEWIRRPDNVDLSTGSWLLLARARHQLKDLARVAWKQGVVYTVAGESSVDLETVQTIRAYEALRRGDAVEAGDVQRVLKAVGVERKLDDHPYNASELGLDVGSIWHDALIRVPLEEREYLLKCLRRGEKLGGPPRVQIDTIHASKGREADNVLLLTDMTERIAKAFKRDEDPELRVWYVGITRASSALYIVQPRTMNGFRL
jgi:superfamily I DNA/RNA helicase